MTLEFALKIADSHALIEDVLEYQALSVLAAEVRKLHKIVHVVGECSECDRGEK